MTDAVRAAWLAGQWIVVRLAGRRDLCLRRQVNGSVIQHGTTFITPRKAQKYADKLNGS